MANVEKVVKPPHTPVVSSKYNALSVELFLLNIANRIPKRKQPNRLTDNVPHGNPGPHIFFMHVESQYLMAPPMKLPVPTISNDFSISFQFLTVRKRITHSFAEFHITMTDTLIGDELHFFHIRLTVFSDVGFIY